MEITYKFDLLKTQEVSVSGTYYRMDFLAVLHQGHHCNIVYRAYRFEPDAKVNRWEIYDFHDPYAHLAPNAAEYDHLKDFNNLPWNNISEFFWNKFFDRLKG